MSARVSLSASEGDLLARIAVDSGMLLPKVDSNLSVLSAQDQRTCKRLAKKGVIELISPNHYRINALGIERSKQVY